MKTLYGIKQKYNLKDYVAYYQSRNGDGQLCNKQYGWVNGIDYRCNIKGEIELTYTISDFIGSSSGYLVRQEAIIKRATPKELNYNYREYLKNIIKRSENSIERLKKQIKEDTQKLSELDKEIEEEKRGKKVCQNKN